MAYLSVEVINFQRGYTIGNTKMHMKPNIYGREPYFYMYHFQANVGQSRMEVFALDIVYVLH